MNINGQTVDNVHLGDTLITGDLTVEGDQIIEGGIEFKGDVLIAAPNCLKSDCLEPFTASASVTVKNSGGTTTAQFTNSNNFAVDQMGALSGGNLEFLTSGVGPATTVAQANSDGTFQIADYKFPVADGTAGQVLETDGLGVLTFGDAGASGSFVRNLYSMRSPTTIYTIGVYGDIDIDGTGTKSVQAVDFPINSSIRVTATGNYTCSITATRTFRLNIGGGSFITTTGIPITTTGGHWQMNFVLYNIDNVNMIVSSVGSSMDIGTSPVAFGMAFTPSGTVNTAIPAFPFTLNVEYQDTVGGCQANARKYHIDISAPSAPALPLSSTNDHTALNNLTLGDAGHTTLALLAGRSGGQTLSGGDASGESLILRSNSAAPLVGNVELASGLDTKIHRIFSNSVATPLVISHDSAVDVIDLRINNANKLQVSDTKIICEEDVDMKQNDIKTVGTLELKGSTSGSIILQAPATGANQNYVLPDNDGANLDFLQTDGSGNLEWVANGSGEVNTASNVGTEGEGVFKQKTGVDLEFKKLNGSGSVNVATSNLSNCYEFEGNVSDSVGTQNGTIFGGVTYTTGKIGSQSGDFDGITSTRVALGTLDVPNTSQFSISCWFKVDTFMDARLIAKANGTAVGNHVFSLAVPSAAGVTFRLTTGALGTGTQITGATALSAATWYHFIAWYDGVNYKIYLDGVQDATASKTGLVATSGSINTCIGNQPAGGGGDRPFDGQIDQVIFWDKALSAQQISNLYNSGTGNPCSFFDQDNLMFSVIQSGINLSNITVNSALDMKSQKITSVANPTLAQDASTKSYADARKTFTLTYGGNLTANNDYMVANGSTKTVKETVKSVTTNLLIPTACTLVNVSYGFTLGNANHQLTIWKNNSTTTVLAAGGGNYDTITTSIAFAVNDRISIQKTASSGSVASGISSAVLYFTA